MTLVRKPFEELMTLPHVVDRFFEEPFFRPSRWLVRGLELPAVDVKATPDEILVEAALPGVKPEDVEVSVDGEVLTIKGSFKREEATEETGYMYRELSRGEFSRTIALPAPVRIPEAKASFKDGMLTLTLPKAIEAKPAKIEVTAG
jgi:HSP20 family protein